MKKLAHTKAGKKCSEAAAADGDVAMDEEVEAVDSVQLDSSSSSKWSLYEVLTPLAERLLQTPVSCVRSYDHLRFYWSSTCSGVKITA